MVSFAIVCFHFIRTWQNSVTKHVAKFCKSQGQVIKQNVCLDYSSVHRTNLACKNLLFIDPKDLFNPGLNCQGLVMRKVSQLLNSGC